MPETVAVVMAAGKGTRMNTELPKVVVPVCGRPMLLYVLDALAAAGIQRVILVVGYRADEVRRTLDGRDGVECVEQTEQLGTGHAVMVCRGRLAAQEGPVLVIAGDSPMIQSESIRALLDDYERAPAACILGTALKENPHGLGRIVRDQTGEFLAIVEERDATDHQRQIQEVNMSYYVFRGPDLLVALDSLRPDNSQGEYYITDVPGRLKADGRVVRALPVLKPVESLGINTLEELAQVEEAMARQGRQTKSA